MLDALCQCPLTTSPKASIPVLNHPANPVGMMRFIPVPPEEQTQKSIKIIQLIDQENVMLKLLP